MSSREQTSRVTAAEHRQAVSPGRRYLRFAGLAVLVVAVLLGIGFVPTRRLGGATGLPAMAVGVLCSLAAALLAGWLLVSAQPATPTARMRLAMFAMSVRVASVLVLGLAAALSGVVARAPLLLWLALSYVVLLPLEVMLALES
jgi:hypothetical protein